ncbi:hypothetical protein ABVV53_16400 [Novosphingobium sp. RD2P27]|uniref:LPXTG cell wall anchor domain-containing protein n=1 Tax=Novosphingobium kalidii TaxID=3230299 RepID=A0ABV2D5A0_9SPHN
MILPEAALPEAAAPAIALPEALPTSAVPQSNAPMTTESAPAPMEAQPRSTPARTARTAPVAAPPVPSSLEQPRSAATEARSAPGAATAPTRNSERPMPAVQTGAVQGRDASEATPTTNERSGIPDEAMAGLLAALGLGAAGYAAMRSRRRRNGAEVDRADNGVAAAAAETRSTAPLLAPAPAVVAPATRSQPHWGSAPPQAVAATSDERSRVLEHMVAAEPDAANPFTSRKARRRRARLLLQAREAEAHQNAARFDWRTYRSASTSTSAVPPLVTA